MELIDLILIDLESGRQDIKKKNFADYLKHMNKYRNWRIDEIKNSVCQYLKNENEHNSSGIR